MVYSFFFILLHLDLLALVGLLGVWLIAKIRCRPISKVWMAICIIPVALIQLTPLPRTLFSFLEDRFPRVDLPEKVDGLILLGGNFSLPESRSRGFPVYNEAASRLFDFMVLMRRYPQAKVVFAGTELEVELTKEILKKHEIDSQRIIFENKSKNTLDNIQFSYSLIHPKKEETWVLVTSASHIPRAVGLCRGIGWNVIPYPVDYHTPLYNAGLYWRLTLYHQNSRVWAVAMKEVAGLVNNWRMGLSPELIPAP